MSLTGNIYGAQGIAKLWINFNGVGTVAIRGSSNVSSLTDNGTGNYTINFTNAMPSVNYAPAGFSSAYSGTADVWVSQRNGDTFSTTALQIGCGNSAGGFLDADRIAVVIFGD